jgi:HSP20 family protein
MSNGVRENPWSLMPRLQDEINWLFGNLNENDSSSAAAAWVPPVDIHEYNDRFELYVDLPGVEPSKVDLTLEDGVLTLSGQRAGETGETGEGRDKDIQYRRTERSHGHLHRRFVLPDTADSQGVNATGKNGVLTVTIAKHPKALPRRIQISG